MSNTMYTRKFWDAPSWAVQLVAVGLMAILFRGPVLVKYFRKVLQKWNRGKVLAGAPWSTLMWRGLLPWLVIICKAVRKELCPSVGVSVIMLVSTLDREFTIVTWLTWCEVMLFVVVSGLRHLLILLGLLVTPVSVFVL